MAGADQRRRLPKKGGQAPFGRWPEVSLSSQSSSCGESPLRGPL